MGRITKGTILNYLTTGQPDLLAQASTAIASASSHEEALANLTLIEEEIAQY